MTVACEYVTADGFNTLLKTHGLKGEIDFLSIDIDSIDYWLLQAITACTARVLIVEYNAHFGPSRAVTLPNAPPPSGALASLKPLWDVAPQRRGFSRWTHQDKHQPMRRQTHRARHLRKRCFPESSRPATCTSATT